MSLSIATKLSLNYDLWANSHLQGKRGISQSPERPGISPSPSPSHPPQSLFLPLFADQSRRAGLCYWPPMPIATQAAGVRRICLIIIRVDGGVAEMKGANHSAALSKVCLPGWGVLDLSPPPPPACCCVRHTFTSRARRDA